MKKLTAILLFVLASSANLAEREKIKANAAARNIVNIDGREYFIYTPNNLVSGDDVVRVCNEDLVMNVVSLQTQQKHDLLTGYLRANGWTGMFWLSGRRDDAGNFTWSSTGDDFSFTHWALLEPNEDSSVTDVCVFLNHNDKWADLKCSTKANFGIFCEQRN